MADGLLLSPDHVRRLNEQLRWFEDRRGALDRLLRDRGKNQAQILSENGSSPSSWYCLLTDNDSDVSYVCKANPGVVDTSTGFLADPHAADADPDDPAHTVLAIDQTGQTPCWIGDWVECEPFTLTLAPPLDEYKTVLIKSRANAQLAFWGYLTSELWPGSVSLNGSASAVLFIAGTTVAKTVYDLGMLTSTYLPKGTLIVAYYFTNLRRFYAIAAPCNAGIAL